MSSQSYPATSKAIVTTALRAPLSLIDFPIKAPGVDEAVVKVEYTALTPLDLHQADGGLLVKHPHILGDSFSGEVVAVGTQTGSTGTSLKPGDKILGFAWKEQAQKSLQTYATVPVNLLGRVPASVALPGAATVPSSLVTAIHTITKELELELPFPISADWKSQQHNIPILIWGAAGTVGMNSVQVLKAWGYTNILAVASSKHHEYLRKAGATQCFDYTKPDVVERINKAAPSITHIIDCIGSLHGTLTPLSKIAKAGTKVAVMLPVIVRDASDSEEPIYAMDVKECLVGEWADGVILSGVRTHFFQDVSFPTLNPQKI